MYKRSSEASPITCIDTQNGFFLVCSERGTVHIFKQELEENLTANELTESMKINFNNKNSRVRETRSHATFKAVEVGVKHFATFTCQSGEFIVISKDGLY